MGTDEHPEARKQRLRHAAITKLEQKLGIPQGTMTQLLFDDNDWSFLIRTQVFVEATLAHAINEKLKQPGLEQVIESMHLKGQWSLLRFGSALGLLSKQDEAYLEALSTVRNRFAHKLENIGGSLETFLMSLSANQFGRYIASWSYMEASGGMLSIREDLRRTLATQVRKSIFQGALVLCSTLAELSLTEEERVGLIEPPLQ